MGDRPSQVFLSEVIAAVNEQRLADGSRVLQERTERGMRGVMWHVALGETTRGACKKAGVTYSTYGTWRDRYPAFAEEMTRLTTANRVARQVADSERRRVQAANSDMVVDFDREMPPRPGLIEFRQDYLGRPTPIHQVAACKALEDQTNLVTFVFGPTGMGKDTLAGDFVLQQVAPDRSGMRVAWFMENEDFSKRRLRRLSQYLVDPRTFEVAPSRTPGASVPSRSIIEDWGPFRWERGMVTPDGDKIDRPQWTTQQMYFMGVIAPEADPNLWATGVEGATYGARIDLAVLSDVFTVENQKSPTRRRDQMNWIKGTLDTRFDEDGRLVIIGTMLPDDNNYEVMLEEYVGDARVISEERYGPGVYTKYSNGVAVVVVKALWDNPETGEVESYWPERFPLEAHLVYKGDRWPVESLSDERVEELGQKGAKRVRGLLDRQKQMPRFFKAMFMQERDVDAGGDFTTAVLDLCDDPLRTYGVVYPHELTVIGVDAATTGGAAWAAVAIDRKTEIVTIVDWWWGEKLGVTGIKNRLIIEPLTKYAPPWLAYEVNHQSAVLDDYLIKQALADFGTSVHDHRTGANRGSMEMGVGSMAAFMRARQIRFPTQTAEDREKTKRLKAFFLAWEKASIAEGRSRPARSGWDPDDVTMAIWPAWLKARSLVTAKVGHDLPSIPIPDSVRRRWERMTNRPAKSMREVIKPQPTDAYDLINQFIGD